MNKKQIQEKINTNRYLINKALNTDLDIHTMNAIIKNISLHNDILITRLNNL